MRRPVIAAVALAAALVAGGCGFGPDKSREDAHDTQNVDKTSPQVLAFNNRYSNVETKCDGHGHRVFVTTAKLMVVLPDPSCPGFVQGQEPAITAGVR